MLDVLLHGQEDIAAELRGARRRGDPRRHPRRGAARAGARRRRRASSTWRRSSATRRARATPELPTRSTSTATRALVADAEAAGVRALRVRLDLLELRPHGRPDGADRRGRRAGARVALRRAEGRRWSRRCSAAARRPSRRPACASPPSTASAPRMRFDLTVNEFTRDLWADRELEVFGEQFWRPYIHVRDAARAVRAVLDAPAEKVAGEVFNAGDSGENYRKLDLVEDDQPADRHAATSRTCTATRTRATTRSASRRSRAELGFEPLQTRAGRHRRDDRGARGGPLRRPVRRPLPEHRRAGAIAGDRASRCSTCGSSQRGPRGGRRTCCARAG